MSLDLNHVKKNFREGENILQCDTDYPQLWNYK